MLPASGSLGATWLVLKTDGPVAERTARYGSVAAMLTLVLLALAGVWVAFVAFSPQPEVRDRLGVLGGGDR